MYCLIDRAILIDLMNILKGVATVGLLTLLSRISGYVRDIFISSQLGTGIAADIFVVILRLPNLFRSLFGEGALNTAFTPIYTEILHNKGLGDARKFAGSTQTILVLILGIFCISLCIMMPEFMDITTPGFSNDPHTMLTITSLSRITISYLFFISLVAFYGGILNSHNKYGAFASAPIILNLSLIIACGAGRRYINLPILEVLAYAVTIAGFLELIWMLLAARFNNLLIGFTKIELSSEIKKFFKRILPVAAGSGVWQINSWVEMIIVSSVPGGMSALYYADRISQLPLALVGTALGTVLMPVLAKSYSDNDLLSINKHKTSAVELSLFLVLPAVAGIFTLAYQIIGCLFQNGAFDAESTIKSAEALVILVLALPAQVLNKIFLSSFYASGDTRTPVKVAVISITINLLVAFLLIHSLKHLGMAVASVCSAWFSVIACYSILYKRSLFRISKEMWRNTLKVMLCSGVMSLSIVFAKSYIPHRSITLLIECIIIGGTTYTASSLIAGTIKLSDIKNLLKSRKGKISLCQK